MECAKHRARGKAKGRAGIFVVDRSALLRRQLVECLGLMEGVKVVGQAQGASEALYAIRSLRPEVVIVAIMMPDGSGFDLLRGIKKENLAPVVGVLTNLASSPYRRSCMGAGADFFMDKAVGIEEVKRIIEGLTAGLAKRVVSPE